MLVILGQKNIKKLADFLLIYSTDELVGGFDEVKWKKGQTTKVT